MDYCVRGECASIDDQAKTNSDRRYAYDSVTIGLGDRFYAGIVEREGILCISVDNFAVLLLWSLWFSSKGNIFIKGI